MRMWGELAKEGVRCDSVWAVVLHYRLWRETEACVRSLLQSDYPALEILVVDNGSPDSSAEELRARLPARVQFLSLPENRFYAGGMNAGIAWALDRGAAWVLALNNDTLAEPTMISHLVEAGLSAAAVGVVAPLIYYAEQPERLWNAGAHQRSFLPFPRALAQGSLAEQGEAPIEVDYVTGCAMLLRREALERIGAFDERYRMYYEDLDLCQRMQQAGYRIVVARQARLGHLVGRTVAQEPAINRYYHTRNRWRFFRGNAKGIMRLWCALVLLVQEGGRGLWYAVQRQPDLARAQAMALHDALWGQERLAL